MRILPTITRPALVGSGNRPFVVGIDPGKRSIAWAVVRRSTRETIACGYNVSDTYAALARDFRRDITTNDRLERLDAIADSEVWCEIPQIYPAEKQKGDANDLVPCAYTSGLATGTLLTLGALAVEIMVPRRWKGQRDGDVHAAYVKALLNVAERRILEAVPIPSGLEHNVLDAIGIAFWRVGRK